MSNEMSILIKQENWTGAFAPAQINRNDFVEHIYYVC